MTAGAGIFFDGRISARRRRARHARPAHACRSTTPTAACSRNGPMTRSRVCRRRIPCCGSAATAMRALERLEIFDPAFAAAVDARGDAGRPQRRPPAPPEADGGRSERDRRRLAARRRLARRAGARRANCAAPAGRGRAQARAPRSTSRCAARSTPQHAGAAFECGNGAGKAAARAALAPPDRPA